MELVHVAQLLPPRFRSIFLIILPQKDVFLNVFIDLQENVSYQSLIYAKALCCQTLLIADCFMIRIEFQTF